MSQNVSSALLRDELFVQTGVGRRSRRAPRSVTTQHTEKAALVWRNHTHDACAKSFAEPLSTLHIWQLKPTTSKS